MNAELRKIALAVYQQHENRGPDAVNDLVQRIYDDSSLHEAVIRFAAAEALGEVVRQVRAGNLNSTPDYDTQRTFTRSEQQYIIRRCNKWLNWPMMDGTRLADATRSHLLQDRDRWLQNAEGNARHARFLELILARVADDRVTVASVWEPEEIEQLMERARRDTNNRFAVDRQRLQNLPEVGN